MRLRTDLPPSVPHLPRKRPRRGNATNSALTRRSMIERGCATRPDATFLKLFVGQDRHQSSALSFRQADAKLPYETS